MFKPVIISLVLFFALAGMGYAQEKTSSIEIVNSDVFEGDESIGKGVSLLKGNVVFKHRGALMYCDSAYLYQESNSLDAYGNVRIKQGDTLNLTGKNLKYDGNSGLAVVTGDVLLADRKMKLRSEKLSYDMPGDMAFYEEFGTLMDNENVLTSIKGYYYSKQSRVFFSDSVLLLNPRYRIEADSLGYLTKTATALFTGPTHIYSTQSDSTWIYCENGFYDTKNSKSRFYKPNRIVSRTSTLSGDTLDFDNTTRRGKAFGRVSISDTSRAVTITGDKGFSDDLKRTAFVTGNAELVRAFKTDSLFLHADTLFAMEDTIKKISFWLAYRNVRFYKSDLQGVCDSLSYTTPDSIMTMSFDPVIWSDSNQVRSDLVKMRLQDDGPRDMQLFSSSFISSQVDSFRFNQISGRDMDGFFKDGELVSVVVKGNGQSIYYTADSDKKLTGVNSAECSDMRIDMSERQVKEITLINQPDATLYPIEELPPSELMLKGFEWLESMRPKDRADIFRKQD
ncbi:MAG: OstA-like protein [Bacteroidota bacterium]|jgi:lipopolysaccharide export system protein LptA